MTPAEQSMTAFKVFFRKADTDLHHTIMRPTACTTGQAGYHASANLVYEVQALITAPKATTTQALGAMNLAVPATKKVASHCWMHMHTVSCRRAGTTVQTARVATLNLGIRLGQRSQTRWEGAPKPSCRTTSAPLRRNRNEGWPSLLLQLKLTNP